MSKFTKAKAIERLKIAINEISNVRGYTDNPSYIKWHRDTLVAISYIFGSGSKHEKQFLSVRFFPLSLYDSYSESHEREVFLQGFREAKALLESMIREIVDYWDDEVAPNTSSNFQASTDDRANLLRNMTVYFGLSELEGICFELGIDYESLKGNEKESKARGLILYCERTDLTTKLLEKCKAKRPQINW